MRKRLTRLAIYLVPAGCVAMALVGFLLTGDPPVAAEQADPTPSTPTLKVYPCPPASARAIAAQLREEFKGVPNVRIGADDRLGQILVQAPPAAQEQIAGRLAALPPAGAAQPPRPIPRGPQQLPPPTSQGRTSRSVQLRNTAARQIEAALVGALGKRLTSLPGGGLVVGNYRLSLPGGGTIDLSIDHRNNLATVDGAPTAVDSCVRLIQALDSRPPTVDYRTRLVPLEAASPASVRRVVEAIRGGVPDRARGQLVTMMFQRPVEEEEQPFGPETPPNGVPLPPNGVPLPPNGALPPPNGQTPEPPLAEGGLIGPVEIEMLEGLDVLVIRGHQRDVERVMQIIEQIERISAETEPVIVVYRLRHVNCEALAGTLTPLYEEVYEPRQGGVSITALVKPNALLLVGRDENVKTVVDLVKRLDKPVAPETQFQVFRLRYAAATDAQTAITEFFGEEAAEATDLRPRVVVTADFRSNSLIVRASPSDMEEVARLIERIDTPTMPAVNELRVFELYHSDAAELETILEDAIYPQAAAAAAPGQQAAQQKSTALSFLTIDAKGQRHLRRSGILSDVRITADTSANTLLVSAPAESMDLLEAVIRQLDQPPVAKAVIKVFTIENGDALALVDMLETLFGPTTAGEPGLQTAAIEGESSRVQLRFVEDVRTNSIIASGTESDLMVVDAILTRLDESEVRQRKTEVYHLKNAPAIDVSNAIGTLLQTERAVLQIGGVMSAFEQIQREVIVVPEPVSNSLIVSATPRFFKEIMDLVKQLDERPPMVMIEVLIAEVALTDNDEFGVELGVQDSMLFDRSLLEVLDRLTTTVTDQTPGGATVTTSTEEIVSANITPGYLFNNVPLGNSGGLESANVVAPQALSHFNVGRIDSDLGYGGLVLSASSEAVNILVRALKECRRLDVLSRPQIMTLDNQPAMIVVGQQVRMQTGMSVTAEGMIEFGLSGTPENVGIILGVTPRISPDNVVVMEIDAVKSELGPTEEGVPIAIAATGEEVRSPSVNTTLAQTTVAAADGQTVILGGLITKSKASVSRRVPVLADIPLLGSLFRYDGQMVQKTELLIIMTPHVVRNEQDAELIKQTEAARMHWCLCDVLQLTDDPGLRSRSDEWLDSETNVIYPDLQPDGQMIPTPQEVPDGRPIIPGPESGPFQPETAPGPNGAPQQPTLQPTPAPQPTPNPQAAYGPGQSRPVTNVRAWNSPPVSQARYQPTAYSGGLQQTAYQWAGSTAAQPYAGAGTAVQPRYVTPAQQQWPITPPPQQHQWPISPPPQPRQSPVAQPAHYQHDEPPGAQSPNSYPPLYR